MHYYRRRIPHINAPGEPVFLTFRLHGTLPSNRAFPIPNLTSCEAFVAWDRLLDGAQYGPAYLRQSAAADIVAARIHQHAVELKHYELHAWVVMPNHVHLLVTPFVDLRELTRRLKGATARLVNQALGRSGTLWQDECFDRLVRNETEFTRTLGYIENNPVKACLAASPEEYRWSSAHRGPIEIGPQAEACPPMD